MLGSISGICVCEVWGLGLASFSASKLLGFWDLGARPAPRELATVIRSIEIRTIEMMTL